MKRQKDLEESLRAEIAELKAQISSLEAKVDSLEHTVEARNSEINGMKSTVAEAQARMEQCVREHQELGETLKREYAEKEVRMQNNLRK